MNKLFRAKIIKNEQLTKDIYLLCVESPDEIQSKPGQFCLLKLNQRLDPLLSRPFSIFDHVSGEIKFCTG